MRKDFEYWLDAATKHPDARMPTPWQIWKAATLAERECARPLITECRKALAEELAGWDLDPPLAHVKQAHDSCDDWLRSNAEISARRCDGLPGYLAGNNLGEK